MSITGILLNHKNLLAPYSISTRYLPPQYRVENWNRSSLLDMCRVPDRKNEFFIAGKYGIWRYNDSTRQFTREKHGFAREALWRKTYDLLPVRKPYHLVFAGTESGLYCFNPAKNKWKHLFVHKIKEKIVRMFEADSTVYIFTVSDAFRVNYSGVDFSIRRLELPRTQTEPHVSMVKLFFDWHDGSVFGLTGRLIYDGIGLILVFLSISGFYLWGFPKWLKKRAKKISHSPRRLKKIFKWNFIKHNQFGVWSSLVLLIISFTAFFMRPPALAIIAEGSAPRWLYPGHLPGNPWFEKIRNVSYDSSRGTLLIDASDGFWLNHWPAQDAFKQLKKTIPVFVMGSTSLQQTSDSTIIAGSFNGLIKFNLNNGNVENLLSSSPGHELSTTRPADTMITSFFSLDSLTFIAAHEQGLLNIPKFKTAILPPPGPEINFEMPLWNVLFEIHNGRIFKDFIGGLYILIIPLGSLMSFLIIVTGLIDWLRRKRGLKRRSA